MKLFKRLFCNHDYKKISRIYCVIGRRRVGFDICVCKKCGKEIRR